jgi:hypothetical protein
VGLLIGNLWTIVNDCNNRAVKLVCCLDSLWRCRLSCHAYPGINHVVVMQDKHKVTLYLSQDLHRKLKIRSAVELEPMSAIAERALVFYLENPEVVDEVESLHGQVHRLYSCPSCASSLVIRNGEVSTVQEQLAVLVDDQPVKAEPAKAEVCATVDQLDEGKLITC